MSQLARALALPKTTVHRSLMALRDAGWLEQEAGPRALWRLSIKALVLAGHAADGLGRLRTVAIPIMDALRNETEENIHLFVRHAGNVVLIERIDGLRPSRSFYQPGMHGPLHELSTGKAILAFLPASEQEDYLRRLASAGAPGQAVEAASLRVELGQVRRDGFAVRTRNVWAPGDRAVGAPILDRRNRAVAAVSISAPAERLTPETCVAYGPKVAEAAGRITRGLRSS